VNARWRAFLGMAALLVVLGALVLAFPRAYAFAELAARELRYFWWLMLMVALAIWLIWGVRRRPKR
jgi:ABC-type spermidine/putrescine transport system permease subunit I